MIIRTQPGFKDVLFAIHGSIPPRIMGRLITIALVSVVAIFAASEHPGIFARISAVPFTLVAIALSVFMSFGKCLLRTLVGGEETMGDLIIACRSFARPTSSHQLEDPSDWNQTHFRSTRSDEPSNEKCSHSSEAKKSRRRLSLGTLSCDSSVAALKKKLRNGDGTFARD